MLTKFCYVMTSRLGFIQGALTDFRISDSGYDRRTLLSGKTKSNKSSLLSPQNHWTGTTLSFKTFSSWRPRDTPSYPAMIAKDGMINEPTKATIPTTEQPSKNPTTARKSLRDRLKVQIRVATGFVLGGAAIAWIFAGRWPFLLGMAVASVLGQREYYKMAIAKGHAPAYKMGLISTVITMTLSAVAPKYADAVFPLAGTIICCYLLFRRRKIATIADISTTFMGLFYAGYLPSFWVRLHGYDFGNGGGTPLGHVITSGWPRILPYSPLLSVGAMIVFWTWLANASADIGAFFFGRYFGRTRFSNISPKKTVEGACAGFVCAASVSLFGAFLMRWPLWWVTGLFYGVVVGVVGLLGDLFASTFKRDVGWKDSGKLFPGHGGILDRTDSYVLIAPLVYYFVTIFLPLIRQFA